MAHASFEPLAKSKILDVLQMPNAINVSLRTDVDEGVYVLLLASVAVVVFVHVEAKKESFGRDKEKRVICKSQKNTEMCCLFCSINIQS